MTAMATQDRPYHILLAEDSAADVGIVRLALRDQNFDHILHVASDGEEAIAFIEKADLDSKAPGPDLVLLDMHLPRYSGEQILQRLRSTERYAQTPVVVMTSSAAPEDHDRAQKHAVLFYFRKPSRLDEFIHLCVIVRDILLKNTPVGAEARRGAGGEAA
jgi:CheY-like chemotaxis protein